MRLIIVDDELFEVEGVKASVDFKKLGIDEVFEAYNIRQARDIFEENPADIMLCDIEMPQGSGLELLAWVREHHPKTECIFITCHADFKYARQAMHLGSLDYLLKPAQPEELVRVLEKAIEKIKRESEQLESRKLSKLWLEHQPLLVERFWLDILNEKTPSELKDIRQAASDINLPGIEDIKLLPVLISVQRWEEQLSLRDEKIMEFALKNIAQEVILKEDGNGIIVENGVGSLLILFYMEDFGMIHSEVLKRDAQRYIEACNKYLKCDLCLYAGMDIYCFELVNMVRQLSLLERNNVTHNNGVFFLNRKSEAITDLILPDSTKWLDMLDKFDAAKVIEDMTAYLTELSRTTELNYYMMHQLKHYFMSIVETFVRSKGMQMHNMFSDDDSVELNDQATRSIHNLVLWLSHGINTVVVCASENEKSKTVVGKVKSYIDLNIDKELTCEDIASHVYLNPIYLTRIFKKETGMPLSEYLLHKRFKKAKELLTDTNLPVSTVASRVGYTNFSHFSKMFRKQTNLSPLDYRKNKQQKV